MTKKKIPLAGVLAILAALGYGGYTIVKEKDLDALKSGAVPTYRVERVVDGDTFELEDGEFVRLLGIDAPEKGECYFRESKKALEKLILRRDVELRKDMTGTDDFGRLLRYTIVQKKSGVENNILVDEEMIKGGFAVPTQYSKDKMYHSLLVQHKDRAMKEKKGMWGRCDILPGENIQADTPAPSATCNIKGNVSEHEFGKVYFTSACNNYSQVKIDPARGEKYFCSEAEAEKEGFVKARNCR